MSNMDARGGQEHSHEEKHAALWGEVQNWLSHPTLGDVRRRVAQDRAQILVGWGVRELDRKGVLAEARPDLVANGAALVHGWSSSTLDADVARAGKEEPRISPIPGYAQAESYWNERVNDLVALTRQTDPSIIELQVNEPVGPARRTDVFFPEPDRKAVDPAVLQAKIIVGQRLAELSGSQLVGAR